LQLEGERSRAADREQLAEAALVEVTPAERTVVLDIDDRAVGPAGAVREQLGVKLVNSGHYTISAIKAKFSLVGIDGLFPAADYVLTDDGPVGFPESSGAPGRPGGTDGSGSCRRGTCPCSSRARN
jgi:hypothetical protein